MTEVVLTHNEMLIASTIGNLRRLNGICNNRQNAFGATDRLWEMSIFGAMAEAAVAKHFNLYWSGMGSDAPGDVDVGGCLEVRSIAQRDRKLILHPNSPSNLPFVLVYCNPPRFELLGWIFAKDAKQQKYWCDPAANNGRVGGAAFFIPQSDLRPISELSAVMFEPKKASA